MTLWFSQADWTQGSAVIVRARSPCPFCGFSELTIVSSWPISKSSALLKRSVVPSLSLPLRNYQLPLCVLQEFSFFFISDRIDDLVMFPCLAEMLPRVRLLTHTCIRLQLHCQPEQLLLHQRQRPALLQEPQEPVSLPLTSPADTHTSAQGTFKAEWMYVFWCASPRHLFGLLYSIRWEMLRYHALLTSAAFKCVSDCVV